jgi:protein-tyrosine phosphatase
VINLFSRKKVLENPLEEAIEVLRFFQSLGYKKVITTPHVMPEFYPNTKEIIEGALETLTQVLEDRGVDIEVEAAAEYYLDESFLKLLETPDKLLRFGENYLLFETPYINEPAFLKEAIFKINALGLQPVMAHPERYIYIQNKMCYLEELVERNVLFQCNINALQGYYSSAAERTIKFMIKNGLVSFLGSDCHNMKHAHILKQSMGAKYFHKATQGNLKNNTL